MDALDRSILALLVDDGRASLGWIGKEVGLSAPAVKRRIDRLRTVGALRGYTAVIDDAALGWSAEAFVEVHFARGVTIGRLVAAVAEMPEALGAWTVSGDADALLHLRARDNQHLEELTLGLRRRKLVERTRSQVVFTRLLTRVRPAHRADGDITGD